MTTLQERADALRDRDLATVHRIVAGVDPDAERESKRASLVELLRASCKPFSVAELEAAQGPLPHLYHDGTHGLLPMGRVTVLASPGRAGKSLCAVGLAVQYALGLKIGDMEPIKGYGPVIIYSAEDERPDYARAVRSATSNLGREDFARARAQIIAPDLFADGMDELRSLVKCEARQPRVNALAVDVIYATLKEMRPALVIFETASRLSDAEEDNAGLKALVAAAERIARQLECAALIIHHFSQAGMGTLKDLSFDVGAIRGMTALVNNSRQNAILLNLGSDDVPFSETDPRAVLKDMVAPGHAERMSLWVTLDSSKSAAPPPMLFAWTPPDPVPAAHITDVAAVYRSWSWPKLRAAVMARKADAKASRKAEDVDAKVETCVKAALQIEAAGRHPTAAAVSAAVGYNPTWARPYLTTAVDRGLLARRSERVPHVKGETLVYHAPGHSMEAAQ